VSVTVRFSFVHGKVLQTGTVEYSVQFRYTSHEDVLQGHRQKVGMEEIAMAKPGIKIEIDGFHPLEIRTMVSDYTGTLSCRGKLSAGVRELLIMLNEWIDIHVISSDSFGTAKQELSQVPFCHFEDLSKTRSPHDVAKQQYVQKLEPVYVVALGNGNNDRLMLQTIKGHGLAIAVDNGEGCATDALMNADLIITGAVNALNLLLIKNSCKATLRS
jgi:soluble P-type ATPase